MGRWLTRRLAEESLRTELCEGPLESIFYQARASSPPRTPQPAHPASPGLLPAHTITPEKQDAQGQQPIDSALQAGLTIERPRSALHSGDFTPVEQSPGTRVSKDSSSSHDEDPFRLPQRGLDKHLAPRGLHAPLVAQLFTLVEFCLPADNEPTPVFYSYASTTYGRSNMDDGPSPYVGQIDLENGLPNLEEGRRARRRLQSRFHRKGSTEEASAQDSPAELSDIEGVSTSSNYRIPEKGQLQIIIKNQNKTAVKLFLIPYDLAGMEPGTKTFIRQRSYSAGPIIEDVKDTAPNTDADRPTLRYLIHLHICCPSKGRHYLYKSIRVVFANRVPDGKERLRNEVTYPDPRFTTYKPVRVMHAPVMSNMGSSNSTSSATALAADKAIRRRSAGFSFGNHGHGHHLFSQHHHHLLPTPSPAEPQHNNRPTPQPINFQTPALNFNSGTTTPTMEMPGLEMTGPSTLLINAKDTPRPGPYDKLNKGYAGYGGNTYSTSFLIPSPFPDCGIQVMNSTTTPMPATPTAGAEGLLSQRLRSLGVQPQQQQQQE
ncbi:hypothetical protein N0V88_002963 [Collariella sp. IMI 366227]|nr:hypothetical protein N0V88_002963 [Collariella sp. IMI 366227]